CAGLTATAAMTTIAARQRANMLPPGIVARVVARIGAFNGFAPIWVPATGPRDPSVSGCPSRGRAEGEPSRAGPPPLIPAQWAIQAITSVLSQRKHRFCVAVADLFHVLLWQIERFHDGDGGADVAPAFFLVERTIGREQHVIRPEERQSANRRRACAGERGVAIERLEIVERPLLQLLQDE